MKIKLLAVFASILLLTGCYSFKETAGQYERLPLKVAKSPTKEGRVCTDDHMWFFSFLDWKWDLTVESARKSGNINEIVSIEREVSGNFFHRRVCTLVKGF